MIYRGFAVLVDVLGELVWDYGGGGGCMFALLLSSCPLARSSEACRSIVHVKGLRERGIYRVVRSHKL